MMPRNNSYYAMRDNKLGNKYFIGIALYFSVTFLSKQIEPVFIDLSEFVSSLKKQSGLRLLNLFFHSNVNPRLSVVEH